MGKFKEIDITMRELIKVAIICLAILSTLGLFIISAENEALKDKINLIEQDRTELIKEVTKNKYDVNRDGKVTSQDYLLIKNYIMQENEKK